MLRPRFQDVIDDWGLGSRSWANRGRQVLLRRLVFGSGDSIVVMVREREGCRLSRELSLTLCQERVRMTKPGLGKQTYKGSECKQPTNVITENELWS